MSFLRGRLTRTQPRLSPPPVRLYSGVGVGSIGVVGESFYRDNLLRLFGRHREGVKERFEATLVWERDNPKDANAVAVCIRGLTVAHLSRSRAAKWRPFMEECARRGLVPTASGIVYAGWDRGPEDWGDFNINLYMEEAPEHDLRRLMDGPRLKAERQAGIGEKAAASPAKQAAIKARASEPGRRNAETKVRETEAASRREQGLCVDCGSPIEPTGARGRPAIRCVSCRAVRTVRT
jgi:hypothetical protein